MLAATIATATIISASEYSWFFMNGTMLYELRQGLDRQFHGQPGWVGQPLVGYARFRYWERTALYQDGSWLDSSTSPRSSGCFAMVLCRLPKLTDCHKMGPHLYASLTDLDGCVPIRARCFPVPACCGFFRTYPRFRVRDMCMVDVKASS